MSTKLEAARWETRMPFHLLIAYEDQNTRNRALHLSHHLSRQLGDDYDFHCSWWKFDHLANRTLHDQACGAALEANMIVLAINTQAGLPPHSKEWIENWLPRRRSGTAALVALVATPPGPASAESVEKTTGTLRALAKSARMDFFCHSFEHPKSVLDPSPIDGLERPPAEAASPDPQLQLRMPTPRWGINE